MFKNFKNSVDMWYKIMKLQSFIVLIKIISIKIKNKLIRNITLFILKIFIILFIREISLYLQIKIFEIK